MIRSPHAPPMALALFAVLAAGPAAALADPPAATVWVADDGSRIRREELGSSLSRGDHNPVWKPGAPVSLAALRDEVVAFQVLVEAGPTALHQVKVDLAGLAFQGAKPPADAAVRVDRFIESYVQVTQRSRNDRRPKESLGWAPTSRPPDTRVLGALPDALVPVDLAAAWIPYPLEIDPRTNGAVWVDVTVPRDAPPGHYEGSLVVTSREGPLATIPVRLDVGDAVLPFRPVSFLAYYGYGELAGRTGEGPSAERQLFQLLHRHQIDAFASLNSRDDALRLRPALDGSLFTEANGYFGPGAGRAPAAVALGAYGHFGDPTPDGIKLVETIVPLVPAAVEDVMLYAVDEDCESTTGPAWRKIIRATPGLGRVRVGHTCSEDPRKQDVDIVMMAAATFQAKAAAQARQQGRGVWVYNGELPRSGTLLLDSDVTGLRADGWIAASRDVGRWFLWDTTFWNDDNSGGKGPIDPFVTAESFHNKHGDHALGDGLLLYPGKQGGAFGAHSLSFNGVVPSMRLKNLRRGIEDAGYVALARAAHPKEADAIVDQVIPAALEEVGESDATPWSSEGASFAAGREALRKLIAPAAALDPKAVEKVLKDGAAGRKVSFFQQPFFQQPALQPVLPPAGSRRRLLGEGGLVALGVLGVGLAGRRSWRKAKAARRS
jgi:hypothetical protein